MTIDDRLHESGTELRAVARTIERQPIGTVGHHRHGFVYALATAAAVLLLIGSGVWLSSLLGEETQPAITQPTAPPPATTVPPPSTLPPTTTQVPSTTVPAMVEPEPAALMTYEEMYRRFEERNARDAAENGFPVSEIREGYLDRIDSTDLFGNITKLAVGERAPDLTGRYLASSGFYGGAVGAFAMDDFIVSPTIVMLWQAEMRDDWTIDGRGHTARDLAAFQELTDTDLGEVQLLSVLLQPSSGVKAQEILSQAGYTFPVVVTTEPGTWGIEAHNEEGVIEPQPLWVALDEEWRVLGASMWAEDDAHFLVAEILGEPDIGPIEIPPDSSNVNLFTQKDGLPSDCISSFAFAGNGDMWVGSWCGVARYDGKEWFAYLEDADWETAVYTAPDGNLWVTTTDAIYRVDGTELEPVLTEHPWDGDFGSLAVTTDGTIWVSNGDQMNWSYDGSQWRSHPESAPVGMAGLITAAPDGSLWAGNETEMRRFDGIEWEIINHPANWPISPSFAPDGTPWVESNGGLFEYRDGSWVYHDVAGTYFESIAFGPDGDIWTTSPDTGAYRYDGEEWTRYTTADGLPTNHLTTVAVAPDGTVWLGTLESGIVEFTP